MRKFLSLVFFWAFICHFAEAQQDILTQFTTSNNLSQASIGLLIKDLSTGRVVAAHQPEVCRNPASVTKIITTASALELFTDTFCFSTRIEISGEIVDSVLHGNLFIRGGGDPTLESAYNPIKNTFYSSVLDTILGMGIQRIDGHIVGDASHFKEDGAPFNWLMEDIGSSYSPTPSCLSVHDNLLSFVITSDSTGFSVDKVNPYTKLFQPKIQMTQNKKDSEWRFSKADYSWEPCIRGNLPLGVCQYLKTELAEPALFVADSIRNLLIKAGVEVDSCATTSRWYTSEVPRKVVYVYKSARLSDIIRVTNHKSINLYAENIFLTLSTYNEPAATCNSWTSVYNISKLWRSKGLATDKVFQVDGSGMSTKNAISPQYIVDILTYMHKESPYAKSFFASLPVAGKSGTVANFMKGTPLEGKTYLKSGSMERVQNFAGYINANNRWYVFCIMVSNFSGVRASTKQQMGKLLNDLIARDGTTN